MSTEKDIFHYVNFKKHLTSEDIAKATNIELGQVIRALVILTADKLVSSRIAGSDIIYDGKGTEFPPFLPKFFTSPKGLSTEVCDAG